MNPVCLCNVLTHAVDSEPDWANVLHGFLLKREVLLSRLLSWPLYGRMIHTWFPTLEYCWIDPQAQSQKDVGKEDYLQNVAGLN
jgi:hypothetical protein